MTSRKSLKPLEPQPSYLPNGRKGVLSAQDCGEDIGVEEDWLGRDLKVLEDTHPGNEPAKLVIVDTQEEGHRVELPLLYKLLGTFGKEGAINGVGRDHSILQEKTRQEAPGSGPSLKGWSPRGHLAA